ncbi:hypothetical protein IT411_02020 [Candidatus Peregrinibacteria bacterium]|nr:hypothetical protein [Candidatus Peregrinibacteria bacterium]
MNYRQIVAEAWQFTQDNKKIVFWYGAIPAFFTTLIGIAYIIYQYYAFVSSKLFQNWHQSFLSLVFNNVLEFLRNHRGLIIPLIVVAIILAICYFFVPVICQGGLIQLIARRRNGQQVSGRKGVTFGLLSFLPLFEYKLFVQTFSLVSIFAIVATSMRNLGWTILGWIVPIFIVVLIAALIMAVFLTYTEFFIVIDGEGVFTSITKSANLVVKHLEETLLLTILMLIIGVRIIIQILFVMLIPVVAIGIVYLLTIYNLPNLGLAVGGIMGLIGVMVAAYLNGIIHTFAVAVWTFTFLNLTSEIEPHARDKTEDQPEKNDSGEQ